MNTITIATRGSKLALWQAEFVRSSLLAAHGNALCVDLLIIKTKGDIILDVPLAKVGGKGLFVKEIEETLLAGQADIAVHSMKDVPMELPAGLVLGAIPERENPSDLFLSIRHSSVADLPQGAVVGTSSLRRQAQLLAMRPDLSVVSLRGNVDTRLRKLHDGEFAGIIMAAAGIKRLGLAAPHMQELAFDSFVPAAGQGAIGIEYNGANEQLAGLLSFLHHQETATRVTAERAFLRTLEGGCQVPIAAFATLSGSLLSLTGLVASTDGKTIIRKSGTAPAADAESLGESLARSVKDAGGQAILDELYKVHQ